MAIAENQSEKYFKDADNKPSMNTNNWDQHQRRLIQFRESRYRGTHYYVVQKVGFITLPTEEQEFIANKNLL